MYILQQFFPRSSGPGGGCHSFLHSFSFGCFWVFYLSQVSLFVVLGIKPRASHMQGKHSTTEVLASHFLVRNNQSHLILMCLDLFSCTWDVWVPSFHQTENASLSFLWILIWIILGIHVRIWLIEFVPLLLYIGIFFGVNFISEIFYCCVSSSPIFSSDINSREDFSSQSSSIF